MALQLERCRPLGHEPRTTILECFRLRRKVKMWLRGRRYRTRSGRLLPMVSMGDNATLRAGRDTMPCTMPSEVPAATVVFARALILAQSRGASEIGVDDLLVALDRDAASDEANVPRTEPFSPVPKLDMPLSRRAASAIAPLGDIFSIPLTAL